MMENDFAASRRDVQALNLGDLNDCVRQRERKTVVAAVYCFGAKA